MSKLSIIMPVYKVEAHISTAIESVLKQHYKDWELIIVNDGSPDRSVEIALKYAALYPNIRVVTQENKGLSGARNTGLRYASGDYIHFFDSDDRILPNHYEDLFNTLNTNTDVLIAGYLVEYLDSEGKSLNITERECNISIDSSIDYTLQYVCYAWNKLFKRTFLINNNLRYEEGLARIEDAEFMNRVINYSPKIQYCKKGYYVYEQRPELTLSKGFDKNLISIAKRRIGIDTNLLAYFLDINSNKLSDLREFLLLRSMLSTIHRLYGISMITPERIDFLKEIGVELLPKEFSLFKRGQSSLKKLYYKLTYEMMRKKSFRLVDVVQRIHFQQK